MLTIPFPRAAVGWPSILSTTAMYYSCLIAGGLVVVLHHRQLWTRCLPSGWPFRRLRLTHRTVILPLARLSSGVFSPRWHSSPCRGPRTARSSAVRYIKRRLGWTFQWANLIESGLPLTPVHSHFCRALWSSRSVARSAASGSRFHEVAIDIYRTRVYRVVSPSGGVVHLWKPARPEYILVLRVIGWKCAG